MSFLMFSLTICSYSLFLAADICDYLFIYLWYYTSFLTIKYYESSYTWVFKFNIFLIYLYFIITRESILGES